MNKIIYGLVAIVVIIFVVTVLTRGESVENLEQHAASDAQMMEKTDDGMMKESGDAMEAMEEPGDAMMEKGDAMMHEAGDTMEKTSDAMEEAGDAMMAKAGSYETYSAEKVAAADGAVLFFKASWCPSCRAADADIKKNAADIPAGVTILEVDFDDSRELKQKYGVTSQHTFVQVDAAGNLVQKWVGGNTLATVLAKVK